MTVKTTKQILFDDGIFDNYDNADEELKVYPNEDVYERRRGFVGLP